MYSFGGWVHEVNPPKIFPEVQKCLHSQSAVSIFCFGDGEWLFCSYAQGVSKTVIECVKTFPGGFICS